MGIPLSRKMRIETQYSPQARAERLIATGRVVLATFSLLAIWWDPANPAQHVKITYALLTGYMSYALLLALLAWRMETLIIRLRLHTHVLDLVIFALLVFFTEGASSPFFVYFVFALVAATLRWQWRGALWTGVVAFMVFIATGIYVAKVLHYPVFELNRFIIRGIYLAVMVTMLGYLGLYEQRRHRELTRLAAWPRMVLHDHQALVYEVLEHAADTLGAPRLLMAWEEPEEPWLHLVLWSGGTVSQTREPPDVVAPLVAEQLTGKPFLCTAVHAPEPMVLYPSDAGVQRWYGLPLHPALHTRFDIHTLVALPLQGKSLEGYLFALDKPGITSDDVLLGTIVAREVVVCMDQNALWQQLQQAATTEERLRLARDLHDGVLQSLTGVALQLKTVHGLIDHDPPEAQRLVLDIQCLITAEQRDLRLFIQELRPTPGPAPLEIHLPTRLEELAARIERQWGLPVAIALEGLEDDIPQTLARDVYRLIHEAVINAARHAQASSLHVTLRVAQTHIHITVVDNGQGFPFHGHYDLAALAAQHLGPVTLRERVAALGGMLSINSGDSGAHVHITMPRPLDWSK
jgi:signal transduction histidine kinase